MFAFAFAVLFARFCVRASMPMCACIHADAHVYHGVCLYACMPKSRFYRPIDCNPEVNDDCRLSDYNTTKVWYTANPELVVVFFEHTMNIKDIHVLRAGRNIPSAGLIGMDGKAVNLCERTCALELHTHCFSFHVPFHVPFDISFSASSLMYVPSLVFIYLQCSCLVLSNASSSSS